MRHWLLLGMVALALGGMVGCQTRSHTDDGLPIVRTPMVSVPFEPVTSSSRLSFESGNYPLLFSGGSSARWFRSEGEADIDLPPDLPPGITSQFHVIQLTLESSFADMSIAYDAVGLRGMQAYLLTRSGTRIMPAQIIMSSNLVEEPLGALRVFRRNNYLIFPRNGVMVEAPVSAPGEGVSIQLRVEGVSTVFSATFAGRMPAIAYEPTFSDREGVQKLKSGTRATRDRVQTWSHTFD